MKKFTVKAHTVDAKKNKVLVGMKEINQPETLEEAVKAYTEADVLARFWDAKVIQVQRELRSGTDTAAKQQARKVTEAIAKAKEQRAKGDTVLFDKMVELGLIDATN